VRACVHTAPKHQFALAFYMFDLDGNGTVDIEEFSRVQQAVKVRKKAGFFFIEKNTYFFFLSFFLSTGFQSKSARSLQTAAPASREELERSLLLNLFFGEKVFLYK
jgi:hypothetical protein